MQRLETLKADRNHKSFTDREKGTMQDSVSSSIYLDFYLVYKWKNKFIHSANVLRGFLDEEGAPG